MKEIELGKLAVEYLSGWGWDVYQEVSFYDRVFDIVAVKGAETYIVECKTTRGLAVLEQAESAYKYANRVSVCLPSQKYNRTGYYFESLLRRFGIGMLVAETRWDKEAMAQLPRTKELTWHVKESIPPRFHRFDKIHAKAVRDVICDGHKRCATAGSHRGGHWSPWRETMRLCVEYVKGHPGATTREIVEAVDHHYASDSSAKNAIPAWLESSSIDGVRCELDGRVRRFYPQETT